MKATILDSRNDGNGRCYLCRISLAEYVAELPQTYQDYEIQREIVNNVYLDHLVDTVIAKRHIPPIVLVVDESGLSLNGHELGVGTFKILDGLQRTFRLKAIRATVDMCLAIKEPALYLSWNKFKLSREFSTQLRAINSNIDVLRVLLAQAAKSGQESLLNCFQDNNQWFEIWTGLSPKDEIQMMLTLNAGHKPVKTRHQLELLFLNLLPTLSSGDGAAFTLVREKDVSATQFSKSRQVGHFHFASVIAALLSLHEGEPVTPSTGLIQQIQTSDSGIEGYYELTTPEFLKAFVHFLVSTDRLLSAQYPGIGVFWMGREVALAGMFGAIGAYSKSTGVGAISAMKRLADVLASKPTLLNLDQFESQRNNLDLSKVNIGTVNRSAIFSAVKGLLIDVEPELVAWATHFGGGAK